MGLRQAHASLSAVETLAKAQASLFQQDVSADESDEAPVVPDIMTSSQHFENGGIGLGREETMRVYLALLALAKQQPLKSVRFWGL